MRRTTIFSLLGVSVSLVSGIASVPVLAQEMPKKLMTKPSISQIEGPKTPKTGKTAKAVAPEMVADAILGEALGRLVEATDTHWHQGEYNHIVNLQRVIVQGDPANLDAFANGAWLLWSMDREEEGVAFLKQGAQANPNVYYMHDELGQYYAIQKRQPAKAIPYLEQAVKFKVPWRTWNALANCYEKTNQWPKAVKAWETASQYPDNLVAPRRLARAKAEVAKRKP